MGKDANRVKLAILNHSEPPRWENIGKVCKSGKIGHSESFSATSVEIDWKSCELGEIGHSESFSATSVGKDWKSCKSGKIGHSESF